MMPSVDARERRALAVFFGGVLVLFGFFAAGAFVGRWPKSGVHAPSMAGGRADAELQLVEVGTFDAQDRANDSVAQLHRQYTSARAVYDASDRLFHVYVGPYPPAEAKEVVDELRARGVPGATVRPYVRP